MNQAIAQSSSTPVARSLDEDALFRKISWRLIPLLFLCYIAAYVDRVNVGFAKLQMMDDLKFSDGVYGLGAGVFFIGYILFEVPSNVILYKVGARRWIARIMISWGVISAAMMFVTTPTSFYVLRFLLGVAEAGFFPGILLYLTFWFPAARRVKASSLFLSAIAFAGIIGGPVSGWILKNMVDVGTWKAWQWLFLLEGIPSILLGFVVLAYLDDKVDHAKWLTPEERKYVSRQIAAEEGAKAHGGVMSVMSNGKVWLLALVLFTFVSGVYGVSFWLPSIIKAMGIKDSLDIGLLSAVPWIFGVVAMYFVARSSDRHLEYRWHSAVPAVVAAAGFVLTVVFDGNTIVAMIGLTIATMGIMSTFPVFWGMPTAMLGGTAAAAGIAFITAFSNLSGFAIPYAIGLIKEATSSTNAGLLMLAAILASGAVLTMLTGRPGASSPTHLK